MTNWKPYLNHREIRQHALGFFVVRPKDAEEPIRSVSCPVCERILRTNDDDDAMREFLCCYVCALKWAHPRREAWKAGWRPSKEIVDRDLTDRPGLTVHIKVD